MRRGSHRVLARGGGKSLTPRRGAQGDLEDEQRGSFRRRPNHTSVGVRATGQYALLVVERIVCESVPEVRKLGREGGTDNRVVDIIYVLVRVDEVVLICYGERSYWSC
jgi:hypothetical protein